MFVAKQSRSPQIAAAAIVLTIGWILSIVWYLVAGRHGLSWGAAVIDFGLAIYFWRASRGHWFPVPLFFIHAAFIVYYFYVTLVPTSPWWVHAFANRMFELALVYVIGCAVYRIVRTRAKSHHENMPDGNGKPL